MLFELVEYYEREGSCKVGFDARFAAGQGA